MTGTGDSYSWDVEAAAHRGEVRSGADPVRAYPRLLASVRPESADSAVTWRARGEQRTAIDGVVRPALGLHVEATLALTCQRCLEAVQVPVEVERHFIFAADEAQAAALDPDSPDDVLALEFPFDLARLIADELLLALPMVPRHEHCTGPSGRRGDAPDALAARQPRPFEVLAQLKRGGGLH